MQLILLDGKATSEKVLKEIEINVTQRIRKNGRSPRLDIILIGGDYASEKYVQIKNKKAKSVGIDGVVHHLPSNVTQEELIKKVEELNMYEMIDGFMIQLPLPSHIEENSILNSISPAKDADGLTPYNLGLLFWGEKEAIASATPKGIMLLLNEYEIPLEGKNVVIVGRSKIVGLPLAALMQKANATVTIAHSKSKNLLEICKRADILVSAVGIPKFIDEKYVRDGAVVIDVGTNQDPDSGIMVGDVDFAKVAPKCSYITPVPGGVGPMTIAALLDNVVNL